MLTPLEVQNKVFSKGLRGYSEAEVSDYLALVSRSMEELVHANEELSKRQAELEGQLERFTDIEKSLKEALVVAQSTADEVLRNAHEKSAYIIERAEGQAQKIIEDANVEVVKIRHQHDEAKKDFLIFKNQFKTMLEGQLDLMAKQEVDE